MSRDIKQVLNQLAGAALKDLDEFEYAQDLVEGQQQTIKERSKFDILNKRAEDIDFSELFEYQYALTVAGYDDYAYETSEISEAINTDHGLDEDEEFEVSAAEMMGDFEYVDGDIVIELDDGIDVYITQERLELIMNETDPDEFNDALEDIESFAEFLGKYSYVTDLTEAKRNRHSRTVGRTKIVNRIRGGKLQRRVKRSAKKGYKIKNGRVKKMDPRERRNRKIGARFAKRKRRSKQALSNRRRKRSNRIRSQRLR